MVARLLSNISKKKDDENPSGSPSHIIENKQQKI
jgi:hypothetical protein